MMIPKYWEFIFRSNDDFVYFHMYTIFKRSLWGMMAGSLVLLLTYVLSDYRDSSPLILGLTMSDLLPGYGIISTVILTAILKDPTLLFTRWYTALTLLKAFSDSGPAWLI